MLTSMDKPKGGRGKKAPYASTHVRVPEPSKAHVELIVQMFHDGELPPIEELKQCLVSEKQKPLPSLDLVAQVAKDIMKQKKSARSSIIMLLGFLYGGDIVDIKL